MKHRAEKSNSDFFIHFSLMEDLHHFDRRKIEELACRYTSGQTQKEKEAEVRIEKVVGPEARQRGWYRKAERNRSRCSRNEEGYIIEVTTLALRTENERLRIEGLTLLDGVGWPTASVLLHFGFLDRYPMLDFRALWSLRISEPPGEYRFSFWWDYVQICRKIAKESGVTMRTLDRALWQNSAENQPRK